MTQLKQAQQVLESAEMLYSGSQVHEAIERMAAHLNRHFSQTEDAILVLPVMNGGLVLAGRLIPRLDFPVQVDYLHATRYRNSTSGHALEWKVEPHLDISNRRLLVIDDIFDEGYTLAEVVDYCRNKGASEVITAVLVEKNHPRPKAEHCCDCIGLEVDDRYVFGSGMDYKSYHRNLDGIYAVVEGDND